MLLTGLPGRPDCAYTKPPIPPPRLLQPFHFSRLPVHSVCAPYFCSSPKDDKVLVHLEDATRFEVLADVDVKIAVFWFVTPCLLLDEYRFIAVLSVICIFVCTCVYCSYYVSKVFVLCRLCTMFIVFVPCLSFDNRTT